MQLRFTYLRVSVFVSTEEQHEVGLDCASMQHTLTLNS
jgi:hypothetical protein